MTNRPNILLLLADEHTAATVGSYVHPFVQTPAMDSLAREGILFEHAYCNSPICAPSRHSFLSVRYLVTSDLTLDFSGTTTIYQKRWKVEEYHIVPFGYRSLKQNASLKKSPACTETTQTNNFVAAMWA